MLRQIHTAYRGSRLWARLARKYDLDQGVYVVLMPEDDAELNAVALAHLDELVADRRASGVVLVTDFAAARLVGSATDRSPRIVGIELWSERQLESLIRFCELAWPSDQCLIVSLTKPFGNRLHRLLDRQEVTKEDLVCLGCLRLRSHGMVAA